jgi:hypothetical protein
MIAYYQRIVTNGLLANHYPLLPIVNLSVFFSLVWLLWYAVSIEIGGRGRSVLTPKTGFRRVVDVLVIAFGISLVAYADRTTVSVYYQTPVSFVHLLWVLAIMGFYGHDLWASFQYPKE